MEKNKNLHQAQKEAAAPLKEISANTAVAEKEKAKVAVIVDRVVEKATEINAVKEDAEKDLALAQPIQRTDSTLRQGEGQSLRSSEGARGELPRRGPQRAPSEHRRENAAVENPAVKNAAVENAGQTRRFGKGGQGRGR